MTARGDMVKLLESKSFHIMQHGEENYFGDIAGEAYPLDYPAFKYAFGEEVTREKVKCIFRTMYKSLPSENITYSLKDPSIGNASITPPKSKASFGHSFIPNLKLLTKIGWKAARRSQEYANHCAKVREQFDDGNTWFFENLCISKEYQGQNKMMEFVGVPMAYLDSINASVMIETHSDKNLEMYKHFGFEVVGEYTLEGSDVKHYSMIRHANGKKPATARETVEE